MDYRMRAASGLAVAALVLGLGGCRSGAPSRTPSGGGGTESLPEPGMPSRSSLVRVSGKLGYVQRVGSAPGDTAPDETEIYGVGAFLLAGRQLHRLAGQK